MRGIRFDAAYPPYPLCAPARAAFMTGRYASSAPPEGLEETYSAMIAG